VKGRPNIFEYDNYRIYLKETFEFLKAKDKKFSLRFFARVAGFSSHNTLWNVIDNRNNLSEEGVEKVLKALKLSREEATQFKNLVFLNQAKSAEEKSRFSKEILRSRAYKKTHPLVEAQLRYYTQWYYVVIREMVNLPAFRENPEWIIKNISPAISSKQAKEAIEELLTLNLLKRDESGRLLQTNNIVETPNEVTSSLVAQFHREFMKKASESIDLIPREDRDISSVTFHVSRHAAKTIKEKIQNFRRELLEEASHDPQPEAVFQLNFQLFPVTQLRKVKDNNGGQES
jgi:uncharacterized protein (TIGR02147 family)